ncbi:AAA family ATPase [Paenibacillus sp. IB182496]|uniref:AAA family ATPase n=1 Tax=Paenibacillus sabuli TaxID=2772509 RepID=A0A927BRJ7_9BACL|nr:AAA family ATPase [Paenibacillus sabuli]MBD2845458.1 AAA family ATPase [Paenibacillus sabuli]
MHISSLKIRNFRNFKKACFVFKEGVNTIIGANGSGKTNALFALRLIIDENLPRSSTNLLDTDFNRSLTNWRGHWIVISLHFDNLSSDDSSQALVFQGTHTSDNNGSLNLYFRPKYEVRKRLFEMSQDFFDDAHFIEYLSTLKINNYESVLYGRGTADFSKDEVYSSIVGNFTNFNFPDPDNEDSSLLGTPANQYIFKNDFACTYAKALRDVIGDLKNPRTSPLLRLLSNLNINETSTETVSNTIRDLNWHITNLPEIRELATGVSESLHKTVGHTYAPRIEINSNLSDDFKHTLKALHIKAGELIGEDYIGDLHEMSLGGANLLYLALKLEEYNRLDHDQNKAAHFLLIEEPEAHLHNHIQKTLFQKYHYHENTQIILTTHSSHISSSCSLSNVNIVYIEDNCCEVSQPSRGLDDNEVRRIERYLDATRSTLLFAKSVILVEGDAELILIPEMVKKAFGISLDEIGVSLINAGSTQFTNIANLFSAERIRRKCAIVTDNDLSIVPLDDDSYEDKEFHKKCKNSQESGELRKQKLDEFCNNNEYIAAFYATSTFEVELLKVGNKNLIENVIRSDIYSRVSDQNASIEKIRSSEPSIFGKEILRLANKEGKGWLALAIAARLDNEIVIPDYLLEALAFVSSLNEGHLISIVQYRLGSEYTVFLETVKLIYGAYPSEIEIINSFCQLNSTSIASKFITLRRRYLESP